MKSRIRINCYTLLFILLSCLIPVWAHAEPEVDAKIIHNGYDENEDAIIMLLDKGEKHGLIRDEVYRILFENEETGSVKILETLDDTSVGQYMPDPMKPIPDIGADIKLNQYGAAGPEYREQDGLDPSDDEERYVSKTDLSKLKQGYKVGPFDVLEINALPEGKLPTRTTVRPDGTVSLPYIGVLEVQGMTVFQMAEVMQEMLGRNFKRPWVEITVTSFNSNVVTLAGAISSSKWRQSGPGGYPISENTRLLNIITQAGGPSQDADVENITVTRNNGFMMTVNYKDIMVDPASEQNIVLEGGDVIYIPVSVHSSTKVTVIGHIPRQGILQLEKEQSKLLDAISLSGGLMQDADLERITVIRGNGEGKEVFRMDLSKIGATGEVPDFDLKPGDIIHIPEKTQNPRTIDRVNKIIGDLTPGIRILYYLNNYTN